MKKWLVVISLVVLFMISFTFLPVTSALVFYDKSSDEIIAYRSVKSEDTFQIIFVHSIHLTDVTEKYEITKDDQIKQYEMIFSDFGIGMPSEVKDQEEIYYEDGFYHIIHMNHIFDSLQIRNGKTVSEHRFVWEEQDEVQQMVYLNDYMEPGALFTLKVDRLTLLDLWREVKIHE